MMNKLVGFALSQRLLTLLLAILLAAGGYQAFRQLPIDAFPDVSPTQVKIIIKAPGMTPEEVETRITAPIEVELLGIPNQTMLRSISKYALTDITLDFSEGTDIYWARQQVAERLNSIWSALPAGIEGGIAPMTTPLGEMFMFTVDGDLSLTERRTLLEWVIRPALRTVPGVADVNVLGGYVRTFEIIPDPFQMAARGVDSAMLEEAITANNSNDGSGRINEGEETLLVRAQGRIETLDDLASVVVRSANGIPVSVADVADVRIGSVTRYGAVTQNGEDEAVQGLVLGLRGANAGDIVAGTKAKLDEIRAALPDGVTIICFIFDDLERYRSWWLVVRDGKVDLCTENPGLDVNLYISSTMRDLVEVWEGEVPIKTALRKKLLRTQGDRQLEKTLPQWLGINPYAEVRRGDPEMTRVAADY